MKSTTRGRCLVHRGKKMDPQRPGNALRLSALLALALLLMIGVPSLASSHSQTRVAGSASGDWDGAEGLIGGAGCATSTARDAYLFLTGFGFSLPDNAEITGVEVSFTAGHSAGGRFGLYLLREGATTGRWKTVGLGTHVVSCNDTWTRGYGGPSDVWNTTWSADEVNDSGFGLRIASGTTDGTRYVRAVSITVYYDMACDAPSIVTHPGSATVTAGDAISLSVEASGTAPLVYRWEKRTTGAWEEVPGATANTHTIPTAVTADAGDYRAIVSNDCGISTSDPATVTVAKRTPELSWNAPAGIVYGTVLGDLQLNATADADGSFFYTPDAGTLLPAGTHTLTVRFAPDDEDNIEAAAAEVTIAVEKAAAVIDVIGYTGDYDGASHGATGSATGVQGEDLSAELDLGGSFVNVPGGTAAWTFADSTGNYNHASGSVDIALAKADAVIDVIGYTGDYDGASHGATGSATGVDGQDLSAGLDFGDTFVNVPGGTAFWTFADSTGNHNDASGSVDIVIRSARLAVTAADQRKRFDEQPFIGFTVRFEGFLAGDGPTVLDGELRFDGDAVEATDPGTYTIVPAGLGSSNYDVRFVPGTLTITPAYHASPVEGAAGFADAATLGGGGALEDIVLKAVYEIGEPIVVLFVVTDFYGENVTDAVAMVCLIEGETPPAMLWFVSEAGYDPELGSYVAEFRTDSFWGTRPQPGIYVLDITLADGSHYQETLELIESAAVAE